uniref:Uncharacterized protein n=1 Tax=Oryza nivara TaxID=4536 RepID=A0A0E0GBY9_ORYNI
MHLQRLAVHAFRSHRRSWGGRIVLVLRGVHLVLCLLCDNSIHDNSRHFAGELYQDLSAQAPNFSWKQTATTISEAQTHRKKEIPKKHGGSNWRERNQSPDGSPIYSVSHQEMAREREGPRMEQRVPSSSIRAGDAGRARARGGGLRLNGSGFSSRRHALSSPLVFLFLSICSREERERGGRGGEEDEA